MELLYQCMRLGVHFILHFMRTFKVIIYNGNQELLNNDKN